MLNRAPLRIGPFACSSAVLREEPRSTIAASTHTLNTPSAAARSRCGLSARTSMMAQDAAIHSFLFFLFVF